MGRPQPLKLRMTGFDSPREYQHGVSEWLGGGLQPHLRRFESCRRVHTCVAKMVYALSSEGSAARLRGPNPLAGTTGGEMKKFLIACLLALALLGGAAHTVSAGEISWCETCNDRGEG
jgi:hypothetical protein